MKKLRKRAAKKARKLAKKARKVAMRAAAAAQATVGRKRKSSKGKKAQPTPAAE